MTDTATWYFNEHEFTNLDSLTDFIFSEDFVKYAKRKICINPAKYNMDFNPTSKTFKLFYIEHRFATYDSHPSYKTSVEATFHYNMLLKIDGAWKIKAEEKGSEDEECVKILTKAISYILKKELSEEDIQEFNEKIDKYFENLKEGKLQHADL